MKKILIVDTMFARMNMGGYALDELRKLPDYEIKFKVLRTTVPGFKDLAVECKKRIEEEQFDIALAMGMPGKADIDKVCAHEASQGIMLAQLMTNTHILEVFVHEDEANTAEELLQICENRCRKHAINAYNMLFKPEKLVENAGMGVRQGSGDAGPLTNGAI